MSGRVRFVPSLVVLTGPPLHGKTTVASALAEISNLQLVDLDAVRLKLFPDFADQPAQLDATTQAYHLMVAEALDILSRGQPVIMAATFSRKEFQAPLYPALASTRNRIFRLRVQSLDCIKARIEKRRIEGTLSAIRTEDQYQWSLGLVEPWPEDVAVVDLDGAQGVDAIVKGVLNHCRDLTPPMPPAV